MRLFQTSFILFKYLILGISWAVGGDYTYSQILTVANTLRKYNPELKGFSTKGYVMPTNGQHITKNSLNVGK